MSLPRAPHQGGRTRHFYATDDGCGGHRRRCDTVRVSSRRIISTYMTLAGLYTLSASLIWSVNTLFLLDAGLGIGEVFIANALFSAGMVLFEIPTGVVADTLGRRISYLFRR